MNWLGGNSALFWAPKKVGVRQPLLIFSPRLALGTLEDAGVTSQFRFLCIWDLAHLNGHPLLPIFNHFYPFSIP